MTTNTQLTAIASDIVLDKVVKDTQSSHEQLNSVDHSASSLAPAANHTDGGLRGADDDDDDETTLQRLRATRIAELKSKIRTNNVLMAKGHGSYDEIDESQFLDVVCRTERVVCHFFHRYFERCMILDGHLKRLAAAHIGTRFIRMNAEKALFFVERLAIQVLPTLVIFLNGIAIHSVVGFSEMGGTDKFSSARLAKVIRRHKGVDSEEHVQSYGDERQQAASDSDFDE